MGAANCANSCNVDEGHLNVEKKNEAYVNGLNA